MPYFEVNFEPSGTPDPLVPPRSRLGAYSIANRHAFDTQEEVIEAIERNTSYPNADKYVVEAETSRDALALFNATISSGSKEARIRLVRKSD